MKKEAYFFPHYCNARNDTKLIKLRRVLGIEGYGIYFILLELLREQTEFRLPLNIIPEIEYDLHVSKEKIEAVVTQFDLFYIDDNHFFSPKLIENLQQYLEKSKRATAAVTKRWQKYKELQEYKCNTNVYTNELPPHIQKNKKTDTINKVNNKLINESNNKISSDNQFLKFWDLYDKKIEPKKCKEKFLKLNDSEVEKIFETLPEYVKSTPDKQYRKNPITYLNQEHWNSEIIYHNIGNNNGFTGRTKRKLIGEYNDETRKDEGRII